MMPRRWHAAVTALVLVGATAVAALAPVASAAFTARTTNPGNTWTTGAWDPPGSVTFLDTGSAQAFTVPVGYYSVTVEAWGAQGGGNGGGHGAYAKAVVPVQPDEQLQVNVGAWPSGRSGGQTGGLQSGGDGGTGNGGVLGLGAYDEGDGGGGASEVRRGTSELVVAGGGGGSSEGGGGQGGETPFSAVRTRGQPGAPGGCDSVLGLGGGTGGGGGGGGYLGGTGGECSYGGGGGSSYVGAVGNTGTQTISGERIGHGQVVITWG